MMQPSELVLLDHDHQRADGRRPDQLRPITITAGVVTRADGSASIEWGGTKIVTAVYGPREVHPRYLQDPTCAVVQARYKMAPFSVPDRKRPGMDRRSTEISKVISEVFTNVIFTERFPRTSIDIYIEVLQADAGTRCAGITCASVALADAGIPMRDLVPACAVGKLGDVIVLDLDTNEDQYGAADLPVALVPRTDEWVLLQMEGRLAVDEFETALEVAHDACLQIYELQKEALYVKYSPKRARTEPAAERTAAGIDQGVED